MGQNNDRTERGEPQGQQGKQRKLSPQELKRQSGYAKPFDRSRFSTPDDSLPNSKESNAKSVKQ